MLEGCSTLFSCVSKILFKVWQCHWMQKNQPHRMGFLVFCLFLLKEFDLGKEFIEWVKLLYHNPLGTVITCQGCPISPLLFAIYCVSLNQKYPLCQSLLLLMSLVSFLVTKYILVSRRPCHWVRCTTPFPLAYRLSDRQQKVLVIQVQLLLLCCKGCLKQIFSLCIQDDLERWSLPLSMLGRISFGSGRISNYPTFDCIKWVRNDPDSFWLDIEAQVNRYNQLVSYLSWNKLEVADGYFIVKSILN